MHLAVAGDASGIGFVGLGAGEFGASESTDNGRVDDADGVTARVQIAGQGVAVMAGRLQAGMYLSRIGDAALLQPVCESPVSRFIIGEGTVLGFALCRQQGGVEGEFGDVDAQVCHGGHHCGYLLSSPVDHPCEYKLILKSGGLTYCPALLARRLLPGAQPFFQACCLGGTAASPAALLSYKGAQERGATLAFLDESGFSLRPSVRRTWAPRGQTPIIRHKFNWKRLHAIGTITCRADGTHPDLLLQVQQQSVTGDAIIASVNDLHQQVEGPVVLLWDGLPAHRSKRVQAHIQANSD